MNTKINTVVSVSLAFDSQTKKAVPKSVRWNGRIYPILTVGLHHSFRLGRTLFHVFSVASKTLFFRLVFNTDNLQWYLEEVSDGLPQ